MKGKAKFWQLIVMSCVLCLCASVALAEEPYRFTLAYGPWDLAQGRIGVNEQPDDPYFQYVEKTYGVAPLTISWEWEGITGYIQGMRMYIASGDLPDAMKVVDLQYGSELIEAGVLLPLDDLLPKYAPKLWNSIPEEVWNVVRSQASDRKIYYIPDRPPVFWTRAGFIRQDWLDRVGMEVPTTIDELVEVYKAFRDQDANGNGDPNDEVPVSGREGMRWLDDLFTIHGVEMMEGHPRMEWDAENKEMISHQVSPEMKRTIEFLRMLVEEGLMDPVMPIQKRQDWAARINANEIGHYFHVIGEVQSYSAFIEEYPDASWTYLPLVSVPGVEPRKHMYATGSSNPSFVITTAAKDPAKILQWYDETITSEDALLYKSLGIPGKDWQRTEDGKIQILNSEIPFYKYVPLGTTEYSREVFALTPLGEMKAPILDKMIETGFAYYVDEPIPISVYEGYEDYMPDKATLYREYCSKMVLGTLPMSAWDEYVEQWYAKGGTEVLKRATEWYKDVNNIE